MFWRKDIDFDDSDFDLDSPCQSKVNRIETEKGELSQPGMVLLPSKYSEGQGSKIAFKPGIQDQPEQHSNIPFFCSPQKEKLAIEKERGLGSGGTCL